MGGKIYLKGKFKILICVATIFEKKYMGNKIYYLLYNFYQKKIKFLKYSSTKI